MIQTQNNPAFERYAAIEELFWQVGVMNEQLETIHASEEYKAFELLLLKVSAGMK